MITKLKAIVRNFWYPFKNSILYIYEGVSKRRTLGNLIDIAHLANLQLKIFNSSILDLRKTVKVPEKNTPLKSHVIEKIYREASGLHSLLPEDLKYSYSFILACDQRTKPEPLKNCLLSLLAQTAPNTEILVGFNGSESPEITALFDSLNQKNHDRLRKYIFKELSWPEIINALANEAKGNYFLIVETDQWLRPDFLFRYEQTLRLLPHKDKTVFFSDCYSINHSFEVVLNNEIDLANTFYFPYVFYNYSYLSLLVPKCVWSKVNGLRKGYEGAYYYDLLLRLDLAETEIVKIPFPLFAHPIKELNSDEQQTSQASAILALKNYVQQKNLNWAVRPGSDYRSLRAIPKTNSIPTVHVIIPFKDQKLLTLAAIKSVAKQENVKLKITCIDNNSTDRTIGASIELMGHEVLRIDEPFNYSRLNNLAVLQSKEGSENDLLFFMNNDVELESFALEEMCRWIEEPRIGAVGCRLNYPNGMMQFGGSNINKKVLPAEIVYWDLVDTRLPVDKLKKSLVTGIVDAATGAAMLIKRKNFLAVKGFDEIWYPITYSDTNLCQKLKTLGLLCLYTPFAVGTHHESVSRSNASHEDFVISSWLDENFFSHQKFLA